MALLPTQAFTRPQKKQGLLQRISSNPAQAQLMLMGLGLLGSKKRSQADQYIGGIGGALGSMADAKNKAPLNAAQVRNLDAQSGYYEAQADAEGKDPYFGGSGSSSSAMRVITEVGAKIQRNEQLTPQEVLAYQTAKSFLSKNSAPT